MVVIWKIVIIFIIGVSPHLLLETEALEIVLTSLTKNVLNEKVYAVFTELEIMCLEKYRIWEWWKYPSYSNILVFKLTFSYI